MFRRFFIIFLVSLFTSCSKNYISSIDLGQNILREMAKENVDDKDLCSQRNNLEEITNLSNVVVISSLQRNISKTLLFIFSNGGAITTDDADAVGIAYVTNGQAKMVLYKNTKDFNMNEKWIVSGKYIIVLVCMGNFGNNEIARIYAYFDDDKIVKYHFNNGIYNFDINQFRWINR